MSVDRTYTVTVVSGNPSNHPYHNVGSTNKYAIDGSTATADVTLSLPEGGTFRFDQSDYYNSGHPLRFSTTPNGTHGGGTEYTTGVTTNGTPGSSGAYTQITVAADAPTLYYYCTNHSAMGWTANTVDEDVWGAGNWSAGRWGITDEFTTGWGAKAWDSSGSWGDMGDETVTPTGLGLTSSIGSVSVTAEINTGWGRAAWNDDAWGIQGDILLTGVSATTSVGSIAPADVMGLTGVSATGSVGALTPADVIGVTGVSATTSIGEVNVTSNPTIQLTGVSVTSSVGSIAPADIMGLTGVSATASVGALTPADVMGLTGVSATASVAELGTSDKFGIQAYQAIDTGSNTSYTDVAA